MLEKSRTLRGVFMPLFIGFNLPLIEHKISKKWTEDAAWLVYTDSSLFVHTRILPLPHHLL